MVSTRRRDIFLEIIGQVSSTLSLPSSKKYILPTFQDKCMSEVMRIGSIIISHLSKLWKVKFLILCDVISLARLQEEFEIDRSWERMVYLISFACTEFFFLRLCTDSYRCSVFKVFLSGYVKDVGEEMRHEFWCGLQKIKWISICTACTQHWLFAEVEVNSTWYSENEEPIKSRESYYSLLLYILKPDIQQAMLA